MAHLERLDLSQATVSASSTSFKENLILYNFVDETRSSKAKVLRAQQLKTYKDLQPQYAHDTLKKARQLRQVCFTPASLIHDGVKEGNKYEVLDFISSGVSVDFAELQGEGMSLLHHACVYDDYIIAQSLVKSGASVDKQDDFGCSPLHVCCMWDSTKCAQMLLNSGAATDILDVDGNFAVDLAPQNSQLKATVRKHMQQKLKMDRVQMRERRGRREKELIGDIEHLLKQGASIDAQIGTHKISLLHVAVTNGFSTAARLLLENSANVNAQDDLMWTPLHCAAKYHQRKMVKLLLSHFANPHALTCNGLLPRDLARHPDIIASLLHAEATFLDLDEQRTPVKTKRFSASLLDENDDDEGEGDDGGGDVTTTRSICTTPMWKRDLERERDIFREARDRLRKEIFRRSASHLLSTPSSPFSNPGSPMSRLSSSPGSMRFTFAPPSGTAHLPENAPPLPPRDEEDLMTSSLCSAAASTSSSATSTLLMRRRHKVMEKPDGSNTRSSSCSTGTKWKDEGNEYLRAVVILQRAFRHHLHKIARVDSDLQLLQAHASHCYEELVMQNAEDIARSNDTHRCTLHRANTLHHRNSWASTPPPQPGTPAGTLQHRPLSTGAVPNGDPAAALPGYHHQHQRRHNHLHHRLQRHHTMRVNGAGAVAAGNLYGTYRRGDSICSTDSGVSMMTMDYSSSTGGGGGDYSHHHHHPHSHAQHQQQHRNNIELVGTIRRSLTTAEQDKAPSHQHQLRGNAVESNYPSSHHSSATLSRHHQLRHAGGGGTMTSSSGHQQQQQKMAPPVFIPPLTKTVAKIMSTATGMEAPPTEPDHHHQHLQQQQQHRAATHHQQQQHYPTMPRHSTSNHHQQQQQAVNNHTLRNHQNATATIHHHHQQQQQQNHPNRMAPQQQHVASSSGHRGHEVKRAHSTVNSSSPAAAPSSSVTMSRNHRYGSMLSNRSNMMQQLNQHFNNQQAAARHSWNCENQQQGGESATSSGGGGATCYPSSTMGRHQLQQRNHHHRHHQQQKRSASVASSPTTPPPNSTDNNFPESGRKVAPLPPPRDPHTRLTSGADHVTGVLRKMNLTTASPSSSSSSVAGGSGDDESLPVVPPPLTLVTRHRVRHHTTGELDDLAAINDLPPPPDDFLNGGGSEEQHSNNDADHAFPPPPTHLG